MTYSKETYKNFVDKGLSTSKIAQELNISQTNVRYYLRKYNLKTQHNQYNKKVEKISDEELLNAWNSTHSMNQCILSLGLTNSGGAYYHYKKRLKRLGVDVNVKYDYRSVGGKNSGLLRNKNALLLPKRQKRSVLFKFLKDCNIPEECNKCKITHWNNEKLLLHIHHIDSDCKNNTLDNLEFLCPNCHNIETYAS